MDPDFVGIPPPKPSSSHSVHRKPKHKQVMPQEVIDVDKYEHYADLMVLDGEIDDKNKGKVIKHSDEVKHSEESLANRTSIQKSLANLIAEANGFNGKGLEWDDYDYASNGYMYFGEYYPSQDDFDGINSLPGVEAPNPPYPHDVNDTKKNDAKSLSSGVSGQMKWGTESSLLSNLTHLSKKPKFVSAEDLESMVKADLHSLHPGVGISSSSNSYTSHGLNSPHGIKPPHMGFFPYFNNQYAPNNMFVPNYPWAMGGQNNQPQMSPVNPFPVNFPPLPNFYPLNSVHNPLEEGAARNPIEADKLNEVRRRFQRFKQFDMVEDHLDHFYNSQFPSVKQPCKDWAKRIQEEWRILENDLPDTIFVRAYETRMDLLRAVIVGAEGTPYHDGLFFFDIHFPSQYPYVPPLVHYHSGGLRINPNLYSCGKVCLSLLGTWEGQQNERWLSGVSTVLQVLVSIQALILNQKPFFNEPGYEGMRGMPHGEQQSLQYSENTFILSLKTMVYTMRKPPMHFEDIVIGHFHKHARDILVACKSYMEGAQVGSLVKGGVQDVDEGDKSCSQWFKNSLPGCIHMLLKEFALIRAGNIGEFEALVNRTNTPNWS